MAGLLAGSGLPAYAQGSEQAGREQLARFRQRHPTLGSWDGLSATVRHEILVAARLDPLPARSPLNPIAHSHREHDGYQVENVALEVFPGFFATGNLYRPTARTEPLAAVLCPHGHFRDEQGNINGRIRPDMQLRCAVLARMGAVVLAIDMVGCGDSTQTTHADPQAFALQLWSNMRALDFLISQPNVDPRRIAVTGASGGGSQSVSLTAVDSRVSVSVPVVMVSAHFNGGCTCESGMPIFKGPRHETNLAQMAALAAPRPMLLVSCGQNWTKNTPQVEYPYIREIYALFGKANNIENAHLAKEGHDYGQSKRQAVYPFLARHLVLKLDAIPRRTDGTADESFVTIEPPEQLRVFDAAHPAQKHAIQGSAAVAKAFDNARSARSQ